MKTNRVKTINTQRCAWNLVAMLLLAGISTAIADPAGPVFPPPGGVTATGTGGSGVAGGKTNFYTGFEPASFTQLYWTFYAIQNPISGAQSPTGQMTFTSYNISTGIATWSSTANMTWNSVLFGAESIATKFVMQLQPYTGTNSGPLGSGFLTPITAGAAGVTSLTGSLSMMDVAALNSLSNLTDNFQVWFQYQTVGGTPLLDFYNSTNSTSGGVTTSANGGFYATVPEPSTYAMLAMGGAALLSLHRRKRAVVKVS
jgi:hypothetical protein